MYLFIFSYKLNSDWKFDAAGQRTCPLFLRVDWWFDFVIVSDEPAIHVSTSCRMAKVSVRELQKTLEILVQSQAWKLISNTNSNLKIKYS